MFLFVNSEFLRSSYKGKVLKNTKQISVYINSNIDDKLEYILENKNISKSKLISILLSIALEKEEKIKLLEEDILDNTKQHEYRIKINENEMKFLKENSILHGFSSITKEIKFRLLNTIYYNKFFSNIEMKELRSSLVQLKKIGRNIDEVLKLLHQHDTYDFKINYDILKDTIDEVNLISKQIQNQILEYELKLKIRV